MGKIIALANEKGGTGKTVSTINIGKKLQLLGKKVLLIDLDPQGSLTICFGIEPENLPVTISNLMMNKINDNETELNINDYLLEKEKLHLIPADIQLSGILHLFLDVRKIY